MSRADRSDELCGAQLPSVSLRCELTEIALFCGAFLNLFVAVYGFSAALWFGYAETGPYVVPSLLLVNGGYLFWRGVRSGTDVRLSETHTRA